MRLAEELLENLPDGSHAFEVRAMDTAGNVEATPRQPHLDSGHHSHQSPRMRCDTKISENAPRTKYGATSSSGADADEPDNSGKEVDALIRWDLSSISTGS